MPPKCFSGRGGKRLDMRPPSSHSLLPRLSGTDTVRERQAAFLRVGPSVCTPIASLGGVPLSSLCPPAVSVDTISTRDGKGTSDQGVGSSRTKHVAREPQVAQRGSKTHTNGHRTEKVFHLKMPIAVPGKRRTIQEHRLAKQGHSLG